MALPALSPLCVRPALGHLCLVIGLLVGLGGGCSTTIGDGTGVGPDARPIEFDESEGEGTPDSPAGCDGVTERGECRGDVAVHCDITRGRVKEVDCQAMGSTCLMDPNRGYASCTPPPDPTSVNACLAMGTAGICSANKDVYWCAGDVEEDIQTQVCEPNFECQVDGCVMGGAYCCPADTGEPVCPALGSAGTCEDNKRKYCSGSTLLEEDCPALGMNCFVFPNGEAKCDGADIGP